MAISSLSEYQINESDFVKFNNLDEIINIWNDYIIKNLIKRTFKDISILKYSIISVMTCTLMIFNFTEMLNFLDSSSITLIITIMTFIIGLSFRKSSDYNKLVKLRVRRLIMNDIKRFLKENSLPYSFFEYCGYIKKLEDRIENTISSYLIREDNIKNSNHQNNEMIKATKRYIKNKVDKNNELEILMNKLEKTEEIKVKEIKEAIEEIKTLLNRIKECADIEKKMTKEIKKNNRRINKDKRNE